MAPKPDLARAQPIAPVLSERPHTRRSLVAAALLAALLGLASLPAWGAPADLRLVSEICCYLALAQLWNLLAGYAGLVSVGQQAWVGLGGYAFFAATFAGVPTVLAIPLAGLTAALGSVIAGLVTFRLRGPYFAIGTWVVAEVARLGVSEITPLGGGSGLSLPLPVIQSLGDSTTRVTVIYYLTVSLAVGGVSLVYLILRSRIGLALTALRDNEVAARSLGVSTDRVKFAVWVIVAFGTGCVGALIFLQKLRISPDAGFSVVDWTAFTIFMTVIGGIGTIEGPFIGVAAFFLLRFLFADAGAWYLVILGSLAITVMLGSPEGLWGLVRKRWDIALFPTRRRLAAVNSPNGRLP